MSHPSCDSRRTLAEDRFGNFVAQRLNKAPALPLDVSERLRFNRQRVINQLRTSRAATTFSNGQHSLRLGAEHFSLWHRFSIVMPLIFLVFGLILINIFQEDDRMQEIATVDLAILIDDLPPVAYVDPGFSQYLRLKNSAQNN